MVIQHNISALNAHRNMGLNNSGISKNLEKLSSGYKINRAGDDAAGLAISEKMRGQIRGLEMAEQNASNGVSLIQTAEGGLNETHAILQRMRELAVQSSNGTYQDSDREQLTKEFTALKSEVDRIAESTHYNGIKLLDGSLGAGGVENVADTDSALVGDITFGTGTAPLADGTQVKIENVTFTKGAAATPDTKDVSVTIATGGIQDDEDISIDIDGVQFKINLSGGGSDATANDVTDAIVAKINGDQTIKDALAAKGLTVADGTGKLEITNADGTAFAGSISITGDTSSAAATIGSPTGGTNGTPGTADKLTVTINGGTAIEGTKQADGNYKFSDAVTGASFTLDGSNFTSTGDTVASVTADVKAGNSLVFQIGANGGADQRVSLSVADMRSSAIGMKDGDVFDCDKSAVGTGNGGSLNDAQIDSVANANKAIEIITAATNAVSGQRAELGALQNRLEHTLNNLGVTKENLTAAESSIRDVDMAKEMMQFTKNNILVQASQSMLAQANQLPQGVLQLLR